MEVAARLTTVAIVPAAGSGMRLRSRTPKPFVCLGGVPLVVHTMRLLAASPLIDGIVIALEQGSENRFRKLVARYRLRKITAVVTGGATRSASVRNCLAVIGTACRLVVIHDAARPLADQRIIADTIRAARRWGAAIAACDETDTVKRVSNTGFIRATVDRRRLVRAQTPQAFRPEILRRAYAGVRYGRATDDAALVEALGGRIKIVPGSARNIKITTPEDLKMAEALLL